MGQQRDSEERRVAIAIMLSLIAWWAWILVQ